MKGVAVVAVLLALLAAGGCPRVDSVGAPPIAGDDGVNGALLSLAALSDAAAESQTDYDAHLARLRAGECFGLGARLGTRGSCLVIIEHHIDVARESYYDAATKDFVAEYLCDPMSEFEGWIVGSTDCADEPFVESEYILRLRGT